MPLKGQAPVQQRDNSNKRHAAEDKYRNIRQSKHGTLLICSMLTYNIFEMLRRQDFRYTPAGQDNNHGSILTGSGRDARRQKNKKKILLLGAGLRTPDRAALVRNLENLWFGKRATAGIVAPGPEQFCLRYKSATALACEVSCHALSSSDVKEPALPVIPRDLSENTIKHFRY